MANSDELWTELCKQVFGVAPFELTPPPDPTRILYVMSHLKLRETLSFGSTGRGWGLTSRDNNIPVISASAFWTFGRLKTKITYKFMYSPTLSLFDSLRGAMTRIFTEGLICLFS
ncbi:hypothetical protein ACHAW5_005429 [Stephanodiscus triporus]|uniref:F-box domain-containing protein n=1 Tax=Stephanodiscus triporus TaxID=2934178 RepID=A0ABD3P177_9STRA